MAILNQCKTVLHQCNYRLRSVAIHTVCAKCYNTFSTYQQIATNQLCHRTSSIITQCRYQTTQSEAIHNDTIYTLSTNVNKSQPCGIAVVRISGAQAIYIHNTLTQSNKQQKLRLMTLHNLYNPITQQLIEHNILTVIFNRPNSYTGEDCVELHIHGNYVIAQLVLQAIADCNKLLSNTNTVIRLSKPGEFTKRALYNDKLNLLTVESLNTLLNVQTEQQHKHTMQLIHHNSYHNIYTNWRTLIITCLAHIEAIIDFSEDEDDVAEHEILTQIQPKINTLYTLIQQALNNNKRSELIQHGIEVCIVGPPNSGKSSLINLLSQRQISIVSSLPGTTRDIIECKLNINGYAVILSDTAGLRYIDTQGKIQSHEHIEEIGVQRTRDRLQHADIKLLMLDINQLLTNDNNATDNGYDSSIGDIVDGNTVLVLNKLDTVDIDISTATDIYSKLQSLVHKSDTVQDNTTTGSITSALHKLGITTMPSSINIISCDQQLHVDSMLSQLTQLIEHKTETNNGDTTDTIDDIPLIVQQRHYEHLNNCIILLNKYNTYMKRKDIVLAAEQLRQCVKELGMIIGTVHVEQLLDVIFKDFCIGK